MKSLISKIRLNKLRRQTLEQPEQPSVANPIVSESQSTVNKEKVLPVEPMPDKKKSGESQSTPSKSVAKPNKQSKEEKIQVQKPKSRPTAKSRKKIPTTEKKSKPDIPS
ncbi:MAG: hypothetical protein H7A34_04140 [bacterium]|nr:hypothetical protein [bacterium]